MELRFAREMTLLFGLVATHGAIVAAQAQTTLLETLVTWLGYFAGPLLGLFLLGMLTRRANEFGALVGTGVAILFVLALAWAWTGPESGTPYKPWGFHRLWFAPFSCALTIVLGFLASLLRPPPSKEQLHGLTRARISA